MRIPAIEALRLPLAVLVVLIHTYNSAWDAVASAPFHEAATYLCRTVTGFAVPMFFVLSGYLYFAATPSPSLADYRRKWRRRVQTLLLPYLVWNLIAWALYALRDVAAGSELQIPFTLQIFWGCKEVGAATVSGPGWPVEASTGPVLMPLWFVRDLLVINVLAPVIRWLLRPLHGALLVVLALLFYSHCWPNYGGVTLTGLWFFSLGAWFALSGRHLVEATRPLAKPALAVSPALLLSLWLNDGGAALWQPLYVVCAMFSALHMAAYIARYRRPSRWMARSGFFVYAAHSIMLLPLTAVAARYAAALPLGLQIGVLLSCAALATLLCLLAFRLLRLLPPRWTAPLTALTD